MGAPVPGHGSVRASLQRNEDGSGILAAARLAFLPRRSSGDKPKAEQRGDILKKIRVRQTGRGAWNSATARSARSRTAIADRT